LVLSRSSLWSTSFHWLHVDQAYPAPHLPYYPTYNIC
jgi:hypothetical protein